MPQPLHAPATEATSEDRNSSPNARRHRAVRLASFEQRGSLGAQEAEDRDAARTIALLSEALERIAAETTDGAARDLAEDALALLQGC